MTDVNTWSPVDGSNNQAPPDGWPESMLPSGVNNSARANMGGVARWYERANAPHTTGGTENALTVTYSYIPVPLVGDVFVFLPAYANTGPATLNIGSGALPIRFRNAALRGGEMQPHVPTMVIYGGDGYWYLSAPAGGVNQNGNLPLLGSTGTPSSQVLTYGVGAPTALVVGDRYTFYPGVATNTGPVTLTIQGLEPHNIWTGGHALTGGEMAQYAVVDVVWDGARYQLLNPAFSLPANLSISGNINAGGTISGAGISSSGSITATGTVSAGAVTASGTVSAASVSASGNVTATGNMTANAAVQGGFVHSLTNIDADTYMYAPQGFRTWDPSGAANFLMYSGGGSGWLQFGNAYSFQWNGTSGTLTYNAQGNPYWIMRVGDYQAYNEIGPVAGHGAYIDLSDRRSKADIEPSTRGLSEILQLSPVAYRRVSPVIDREGTQPVRRELGFVAQDVQAVLPEAVRAVGITLPDGSGSLESADPSLGLTYDAIVACLVAAVQQLSARIVALEGGGTDV